MRPLLWPRHSAASKPNKLYFEISQTFQTLKVILNRLNHLETFKPFKASARGDQRAPLIILLGRLSNKILFLKSFSSFLQILFQTSLFNLSAKLLCRTSFPNSHPRTLSTNPLPNTFPNAPSNFSRAFPENFTSLSLTFSPPKGPGPIVRLQHLDRPATASAANWSDSKRTRDR